MVYYIKIFKIYFKMDQKVFIEYGYIVLFNKLYNNVFLNVYENIYMLLVIYKYCSDERKCNDILKC